MSNKKSFLIHKDSLHVLNELTDIEAGKLFKAIAAYQYEEEVELDTLTKITFAPFKSQFNRDNEKYAKTCESRAASGSKGGIAKASKSKQKLAKPSKSKQSLANLADSERDSERDSDNERDRDSDNETKGVLVIKQKESTDNFNEVLLHLKNVTGRSFRESTDLKSRLKDYSVEELKNVIDYKAKEWMGKDMQKYLRPKTLFNKTNIEGYLNDSNQLVPTESMYENKPNQNTKPTIDWNSTDWSDGLR
jgi:uncharacterized phage protein (TIGR02220 family)